MQVELVRTSATDGLRLDGALLPPTGEATVSLDAVICLHGVGSSFYSTGLLEKITPALTKLGLQVLWANTRGHDLVYTSYFAGKPQRAGAAYEIVDDGRLDIAAWSSFLGERGCQRVLLFGHSLGAIKSVYTLSHESPPEIQAVIAASPPRLSYAAFIAAGARGFAEAMHGAEALVKEDREQELIEVTFPYPMLITAGAYVDKYGRAERYNMFRFADRLACPTMFIYGEEELAHGGIAFAGLPDALAELRQPNQSLEVATIPAANHLYTGQHEPLAQTMGNWIKRTFPLSS